jgi:hypothetical protein
VIDAPVSRISGVSVVRGADTLNIEISGSGPMIARTMKLTHPDRVVVDIPNSLLQGHARQIAVNSGDVKDIRAARFEAGVTRVVIDLSQMREFEVVPEGSKLVVKLHDSASNVKPPALPEAKQVVASNSALQPDAPKSAKAEEKQVEAAPSRAEAAASHFAHDAPPLPAINQPPYAHGSLAAQPAAINAALQQQQQQPQALPQPMPATAQPSQSNAAGTTVPIGSTQGSNCTTGRYTGEPFGMNFKDLDLKDFFRLIHEISGLNVVLDPSVHGTVTCRGTRPSPSCWTTTAWLARCRATYFASRPWKP